MIQENIFRDKMAVLNICIDANISQEKIDIFYAVISPRMTAEGFLSAVEKLITGEAKIFGNIKTSDIISACDEFLTMKEKTKTLEERAKIKALHLYKETDSAEYEKVIIEIYGSRDKFEEWKEESKNSEYTLDYWRGVQKNKFIAIAEKMITKNLFDEYGIEPKETQGLLI